MSDWVIIRDLLEILRKVFLPLKFYERVSKTLFPLDSVNTKCWHRKSIIFHMKETARRGRNHREEGTFKGISSSDLQETQSPLPLLLLWQYVLLLLVLRSHSTLVYKREKSFIKKLFQTILFLIVFSSFVTIYHQKL